MGNPLTKSIEGKIHIFARCASKNPHQSSLILTSNVNPMPKSLHQWTAPQWWLWCFPLGGFRFRASRVWHEDHDGSDDGADYLRLVDDWWKLFRFLMVTIVIRFTQYLEKSLLVMWFLRFCWWSQLWRVPCKVSFGRKFQCLWFPTLLSHCLVIRISQTEFCLELLISWGNLNFLKTRQRKQCKTPRGSFGPEGPLGPDGSPKPPRRSPGNLGGSPGPFRGPMGA